MNTNTIYHLAPKWSEQIMSDPRKDTILCVVRKGYRGLSGTLRIPFLVKGETKQIPISFDCWVGDKAIINQEGGNVWGLIRLGPGVWQVTPSIVSEDYGLHAYVVLCDVPEPAPFL